MGKAKRLTREEIAKLEVGHTTVSRGIQFVLMAVFLLVIGTVPLVQSVLERRPGLTGAQAGTSSMKEYDILALIPNRVEVAALWRASGWKSAYGIFYATNSRILQSIHTVEEALEDNALLSKWLIPPMNYLFTCLLGAGNEKVYRGRDGWLFYRPGIDYLTGPGFLESRVIKARERSGNEWQKPVQPDPVPALVEFKEILAKRGIDLVIVPAPTKAMLYPEKFSTRYSGSAVPLENGSFEEFKERLEQQGVNVFDTAGVLAQAKSPENVPLYLETDTHWSPVGMEVVAQKLADYIEDNHLLQSPILKKPYVRNGVQLANLGDIANMLNLPAYSPVYAPQAVELHPVSLENGTGWEPDRGADILILGDSFANIYSLSGMGWGERAGLVAQLSYELQRPVDAIVMNDNGAYATRQQLSRVLRKGVDRLAGKKVVIYEFAIRELSFGDWKTGLDFNLGVASAQARSTGSGTNKTVISARVEEVAGVPKPGSVPYKDCVVAIHLSHVVASTDATFPDELVVFTWGMQDNILQPGAGLKIGQTVTLELIPWDTVEKDFGSYNRSELDNEDFFWLPLFWTQSLTGPVDSSRQTAKVPDKSAESDKTSQATADDAKDESTTPMAGTFLADLAVKAAVLEAAGQNTLVGKDGWMFFGPELRSLGVGKFWGEDAPSVSLAFKPEYADPLPAILDFHQQLATAGIELIVVPVPEKAVIYPEMVSDTVSVPNGELPKRFDVYQEEFYHLLKENGVKVLDLVPTFLAQRSGDKGYLYCKQDTHWSGLGIELTARLLGEMIQTRPWFAEVPKKTFSIERRVVQIEGDLWGFHKDQTLPKETLPLAFVSETTPQGPLPVESWRQSPVVLLADSHGLVFHAGGDMHAKGAGLADHLAHEFGFPVDLVAVRGSGATPTRMSLLRRRDNLAGKKLVIWCFTAREFTESFGGWRQLPVINIKE